MRAIGQRGPEVLKEPVSDFMTKSVITARETDTINRLMSEMTTRRFRHMPVVETGRLVGLVSIGDLRQDTDLRNGDGGGRDAGVHRLASAV